jgi:CHAD domain-containing protein
MITKAVYHKELQNDLTRVNSRLRSYLGQQSEDNVHDLRTALRRVETRSQLLQKRLRKKELGDYLSLSKRLFKSTTKIRDLDVIKDQLSQQHHLSSDDSLIKEISARRKKLVPKSKKLSGKLERTKTQVSSDDIKEPKLRKKLQKLVSKLDRNITSLLPLVLKGPDRLEELHSLRMNCKKLRYILEATHSDPKRIKTLENWQNYLGKIHDYDVSVQYLAEVKNSPAVVTIISEIKKSRNMQYLEFVSLFRNRETEVPSQPVAAAQKAISLTGVSQS